MCVRCFFVFFNETVCNVRKHWQGQNPYNIIPRGLKSQFWLMIYPFFLFFWEEGAFCYQRDVWQLLFFVLGRKETLDIIKILPLPSHHLMVGGSGFKWLNTLNILLLMLVCINRRVYWSRFLLLTYSLHCTAHLITISIHTCCNCYMYFINVSWVVTSLLFLYQDFWFKFSFFVVPKANYFERSLI